MLSDPIFNFLKWVMNRFPRFSYGKLYELSDESLFLGEIVIFSYHLLFCHKNDVKSTLDGSS